MININTFLKLANAPNMVQSFIEIFDAEFSMPNIKFKVLNKKVFWTTLAECNGWELQQNTFFKQARIINSDDERIAWGTINGMEKALDKWVELSKKYNEDTQGDISS